MSTQTNAAVGKSYLQDRFTQLSNTADEIDLAKLFNTLWRGKWWIAFCTAISMAIAAYYLLNIAEPEYTAEAVVAFESRESQVVDLESVVGGLGGDQITINTEVEVLRSRGLMEKLVRRLDLLADPEFNAELRPDDGRSLKAVLSSGFVAVGLMQAQTVRQKTQDEIFNAVVEAAMGHISIATVRQSYVFKITVVTKDPQKSTLIANTLADVYILDQLEVKFAATQKATEWLTERVSELQVSLEKAVEAVKDFNSNSELVSPETLTALNRQIKDLRERERDAQGAVATAQIRAAELDRLRGAADLDAMAEFANDRTLTRLLGLMADGSVTNSDAFFDRYDQVSGRTAQDIARLESQLIAFAASISELEDQVATQSEDLVTLQQLEREAEASRLIYEFFLARLKETSVQQGIQQPDSRILSAAVDPRNPSAPRVPIVMAMGLLVGFFFACATIIIREMSQNTFRTADDLEAFTDYTVMGQIPRIPARRRANVLKYLVEKPTSAAAESVRNLRTSVLMSNMDKEPQVIMSTSSLPGEGKTTQSISLAQNLSGLGKRVLLVEGDIRRRVFSQYFDLKGKDGLLSVLAGHNSIQDVVVYRNELGADILMGEKSNTNAADIFSSDAFAKFIVDMREVYDYIIIDTPPVLVVPDARVIGRLVDAILYTVRWDQTTKRQVKEGIQRFESVGIKITGLVLGQISPRGMKRYGYENYGQYGRGYYDN